MATVTIFASDIETHLDETGVDAYSFTWGQNQAKPEIEFTVTEDLVLEFPDLIEKEEFDEQEAELAQLRSDFEELSLEHESLKQDQSSLESEYDLLMSTYNNLRSEKSFWSKAVFWK